MKKISILSLHLGYGGIEKSIVSLANILCKKYDVEIACVYKLYDNCVFSLDDRVKVKYLNDSNIVPNREKLKESINRMNLYKIFKEVAFSTKVLYLRKKTMTEYVKKCDSDVIISTREIFNEINGKYAKKNVLKIGWEHNHYHKNKKYARNVLNSARKLDYFVLVSQSICDYYSEGLINTNCECIYIPNCIEDIPTNRSKLDKCNLISVGRLSPEKGYFDLLKVYEKLIINNPNWTLDIIGDGVEKEELEKYIAKKNLKGVTLHGFRDKDYIEKRMLESSIYLMCSKTESFGLVLIEAMSYGIPCIAMDSAEGANDIIENDYNGYLIPNRDIEQMVRKIEYLINNKEKRNKLGDNAYKSVSKFTSDVVGEEWFDLIEKSGKNE